MYRRAVGVRQRWITPGWGQGIGSPVPPPGRVIPPFLHPKERSNPAGGAVPACQVAEAGSGQNWAVGGGLNPASREPTSEPSNGVGQKNFPSTSIEILMSFC